MSQEAYQFCGIGEVFATVLSSLLALALFFKHLYSASIITTSALLTSNSPRNYWFMLLVLASGGIVLLLAIRVLFAIVRMSVLHVALVG